MNYYTLCIVNIVDDKVSNQQVTYNNPVSIGDTIQHRCLQLKVERVVHRKGESEIWVRL